MDTLGVQHDLGNLRDSLLDVIGDSEGFSISFPWLCIRKCQARGPDASGVRVGPQATVRPNFPQGGTHGNPQVPWKKNITPLFVGVVNTQHFHLNFIYKYMNPTSHWYPLIFHWPSFLALDNTEFSQVQTWGAKTGLPSMDAALA